MKDEWVHVIHDYSQGKGQYCFYKRQPSFTVIRECLKEVSKYGDEKHLVGVVCLHF